MRRYCRIRSFLLAGLLALAIPPSTARAVSISLVPDGSTTIEIGETVNVDVFMVLDAADQVAGIDAVTMHLEGGGGRVTVTASTTGSWFPHPPSVVNTGTVFPTPLDFIAFAQFAQIGQAAHTAEAFLASLTLTGAMEGSYDLVARRLGNFPLFTAPGDAVNRFDFDSDETLLIIVTCSTGACVVPSPGPMEPLPPDPPPPMPDFPSEEPPPVIPGPPSTPPLIPGPPLTPPLTPTDISGGILIPEPSTFALLGLALTGLMFLRNPRRERSKRSPGS